MNLNLMKYLCRTETGRLYKFLVSQLQSFGYKKIYKDKQMNYIIAEGELPVCLVAHIDTVFYQLPQEFFYDSKKEVLWSPDGSGFDDRAGIYIVLTLLAWGYKPSVIFTNEEERGCIGAAVLTDRFKTCPFKKCNMLVQLDRRGANDSVYYQCANLDFEQYINSFGFQTAFGTFSDISVLAPAWEIAAVNLSVGYYDEHMPTERLFCQQTDNTLTKVEQILKKSPKSIKYLYISKSVPIIKGSNTVADCRNYNNYNYSWIDSDNVCIICGFGIVKGQRVHDPAVGDYSICEDCYKNFYQEEDQITTIIDNSTNKNAI